MLGYQPFDETYELLIERPSASYRASVGPPIALDQEAFEGFLSRLAHFREDYPNMTFWVMIDYKTLTISHSEGDMETFRRKLTSLKDIFRHIHPDYLLPFLHWRTAAFNLIAKHGLIVRPLKASYRISLPLQVIDGQYFWFTINSTVVRVDTEGRIVTNLQTFYREGKWSPQNLRPIEASIQIQNKAYSDLQDQLVSELSLQLIDEFTNAELDLLTLYAAGKKIEDVLREKGWSRHTMHEYNANLLRKAKTLFVYDFRSARDFAEYCLEKEFIRLRN